MVSRQAGFRALSRPRGVRSGAAALVLICALLASRGLLSSPVSAGALSVLPDTSDGIHRGAIFVHCYQEFGSSTGISPSC